VATTQSATSVTTNSATLNASVNPGGAISDVTFEYGLTTNYTGTISGGTLSAGNTPVSASGGLTNLLASTTYHYRVVATNSAGAGQGSDLTFTTATPTVTSTPFEDWQTTYFGSTTNANAAFDADPDGDGANNLMEYAFGSNPTLGGSVIVPEVGTSGNYLTITVPRNSNATDISYLVQGGTDLLSWATLSTLSATNPAPAGSTVTYTNGTGIDAFPAQFLRVKITKP
jgi:hypothetical protein